MKRRYYIVSFILLSLLSFAVVIIDSLGRDMFPRKMDPYPTGDEPRTVPGTFMVMSYNIAHGRGTAYHQIFTRTEKMKQNLRLLAGYVRNVSPDIAGFQEVDIDCSWSGNFNHAEYIRGHSSYPYVCYGVNNHYNGDLRLDYGNATISRRPIINHRNYPFGDASVGEKGFLVTEIKIGEKIITFVNVHLDYKLSKNRKRQINQMIEILREVETPLVVVGDFNCQMTGREDNVCIFVETLDLDIWKYDGGKGKTFPSYSPVSQIDFIFISKDLEFVEYVSTGKILTDHRPVIAVIKFRDNFQEEVEEH